MNKKEINEKYRKEFINRGLIPLEDIYSHTQKVKCVDKEGYQYLLSLKNNIRDKRTKEFSKWDKNSNPFKAYNMRLYATKVQENVKILSPDKVLVNATREKIKFICPFCGKQYLKKWCHWINQPQNMHVCADCSKFPISAGSSSCVILVEQWLINHQLEYKREHTFSDCKNKNPLRFDFKIKKNPKEFVLLEVDGFQHFYMGGWTTKEKYIYTKHNDAIKNEYCAKHGIKLIRIPFWLFRHKKWKDILEENLLN